MKIKTLIITISLLLCSLNLSAKEVLKDNIDKNLVMINLGVFNDITNATDMVKTFHTNTDIYTGFYQGKYYQYLVNIAPKNKETVMQTARKLISDAYFVKKSSFDYGVKLLENTQQNLPSTPKTSINQNETIIQKDKVDSLVTNYDTNNSQILNAKTPQGFIKVDLIDAVFQTLSRSYRIKAARERVIQAKKNLEIAKADFKPIVDVGYYISGNKREPGDIGNDGRYESSKNFKEERFTLTIDQNIYAGGQSNAYLQKMQKEYKLAKNGFQGLIESEISKTINAYFDIVFRRDALKINEQNISQLQKILEIVQIKFESGALSLGELSSVEASISNAMSQLSRTKSRYNNALEFYNFITGREFEKTYPYQKNIDIKITNFETLQQKALKNNNKLQGFVHQIAAKKDSLTIAESEFKPKIDLQIFAQRTLDEEDFEVEENEYTAKLNFSYNLYNGGRDKAAYMKAFSSIQESNYEKEAQILELIWNLEKLHTSLMSLKESLKSIKDEVSSSINMVDSYWEGFRYGEQDLYLLLQAQRQLNSAQLQLIDSKQDSIIDFFKILEISGELIDYFEIDINDPRFLNMAKGKYHKKAITTQSKHKDYALPFSIEQPQENNATSQEDEAIKMQDYNQTKNSLNDLLLYEEVFLMQEKNNFSIVFEGFENIYEALTFINKENIYKKSFVYKTLQKSKIKINVAYDMFETKQQAKNALQLPKFDTFKNKAIKTVTEVQQEFINFNTMSLMDKSKQTEKIVEKTIKPKPFVTNEQFKQEFLNADEDFYTINVTTFQTMQDAAKIVKSYSIEKQSFVFTYGKNKDLVKIMYGVYESYNQAQNALESLGLLKENFLPVIEKIERKQKLYKRYNKQ